MQRVTYHWRQLFFNLFVVASLVFSLITLAGEWLYGSITWHEDNLFIRGFETIIFSYALVVATVKLFLSPVINVTNPRT
jgi:hypothetical protein